MHNAYILTIPGGKAAEAFCWMLIHSLWQGLLFTVITGAVMLFTRKSTAVFRYNIMCALLLAFVAVCAGTFVWELMQGDNLKPATGTLSATAVAETTTQVWLKRFSVYFTANAPLILAVWSIVFLAKCVRMMGGLVYSHRVKHYKIYQPPAQWQQRFNVLCSQLQLKKPVTLLQSGIVKIPVVIGHIKPVVFIPLGLLNSMPAGEMEAVLLHELAHIRRNDYFVNLLQVMAENVFFFNPALLWMSAIIREEREHCCDDIAVTQTKSKKQFIQALVSFKEHALNVNKYATAFPAKKNQLLQRATRIISNRNKTLNKGEKAFFAISFVLLAGLTMAVSKKGAGYTKAKTPVPTVFTKPQQPLVKTAETKAASRIKVPAVKGNVERVTVTEIYNKVITLEETAHKQPVTPAFTQVAILTDAEQAELDRQQAVRDRKQALRDREQAELDRQQAERDRQQAERDREQALRDHAQAEEDRKQADRDRAQAEIDRKQADIERAEADRQRALMNKDQKNVTNKTSTTTYHTPMQ